jgi:IclR family pca regulon transcriptional regulator
MANQSEFHPRDMVAGLEKGLAIIEAFDESRPRLSLSEAAGRTGLTRAAARRYLLTLTKLGYASFDGKFFSLTPRILRLGYAYLSSSALPARVLPSLEQISAATGESSSAAILDGHDIVYIARSATRHIMSIALSVGTRLPAYCTSLGRVLLAYQDEAALALFFAEGRFEPRTPKTRTSEAALRAALADVHTLGYALNDEELELGLRSLAVPVFDSRGRLVCAINVGVQAVRMSVEDMPRLLLPPLLAAKEELPRIV